ncbi:oocyte zinc finger protein XlCOF6-like isoform X10 [Leguminivora glycinivorella]|uniref:oocyte zinc finger protein XlCOF6-like isoform X10 n=1 Tax=Leguminivora glycinivorella TaxID=1035111 RepID=UPI00200EC493|nr:oocyte zinc finger protein XlCOF6-like isoform X10 [Leguminivora glycinivorella]
MEGKSTDWVRGPSGPTVCRCCFAEGCYKDISTEYFWMGKKEVYCEMLTETFDLSIAFAQTSGPNSNSRLICEPCISRLRDASEFKKQVQECEKMFMQYLDPGRSTVEEIQLEITQEPMEKGVKLEPVKLEKNQSDDDFDDRGGFEDMDEDDLDDQPLTKLASKVPKKESVDLLDLLDNAKAEKRKSSTKAKASPAKKAKTKKETPKATVSKPKPEKKKKGDETSPTDSEKQIAGLKTGGIKENEDKIKKSNVDVDDLKARKKNATMLLQFTKICPFRWMKNLYLCFYCDSQFNDPTWLRTHNENEHCDKTAAQVRCALSKLKKYELAKADVTNTGCAICDDVVTDLNELKKHLLEKHNKSIDPKSNDGILPFKVRKDEFKCAICSETFAEFKSLNQHMNVHFQNFICEQCGTGFITPERLRTHSFSHETGSFPCDACEKVFRSTNAKNEHYALVHMRVKRHRCPHCPETFRNYFQRNKHVSSIHGLKLKEFKCNLCPKVFTLSGKLGVHIRTVHLKLKRHACEVCEWKFYSKSELKEHMIRHGGERKHQCSVCKKSYARKYTLREHMRIHEDDRRFVCATCGESFVQNCSLKHHVKVHHPVKYEFMS